jgi:chromosomal replication initiator protein
MISPASSSIGQHVSPGALQELWMQILERIGLKLQRSQFITWFKDTAALGCEEGTLVVGLPLPMFLNWHLEHYQAMTLEAAREIDPSIGKIVYTVDGGLKDNRDRSVDLLQRFPEQRKRKVPGKQEVKMAEGVISKILHPRYTLENFVVGTNNRLAHAACQAVAQQPGGKYNPLFLYGGVGLGKTHLLQATGAAILRLMPKAAVVYTTSEDFTNEVIEAIAQRNMEKFRRRYRSVDVLIIDDVQFIANKERTQEEFFHTFNTLYQENRQIIISSDRRPQDLQLEDRLASRFERGMIADISGPDYETRLAILVEKAKEYELFIEMGVLEFIAQHATRNVRELEGILMQAVALYELEQRMPTVKSIAEIMRKLNKDPHAQEEMVGFEIPAKRAATFQDTLEAVSRYYSVSIQDMIGSSRVREVLIPRQIVMYIGKRYLRMSYVRLGEAFSNRDHTTVMNAVEKIQRRMQSDPQILREVRALEQELGVA